MIEKQFEWNIDGVQANTVLEGAEVIVPIDPSNYNDIFENKDIIKLLEKNDKYFNLIFSLENEGLTSSITNEFKLSYILKDGFYYIGYEYNKIFTNILRNLGVDETILKDITLSMNITNTFEAHTFIDQVIIAIHRDQEIKDLPFEVIDEQLDKCNLLNVLENHMKPILRELISTEFQIKKLVDTQIEEEKVLRKNHKLLDTGKEKHVLWKNLMLYTACKSLDEFILTGDLDYYRYAKNYFKSVSERRKCEFPRCMVVNGIYYDYGYTQYNRRFRETQAKCFPDYLLAVNMEDKERITKREVLKKGNGLKGVIPSTTPTKKSKIDYEKAEKTLQRKIKFYRGLSGKCQGIIDGLKGDTDYIGYVLDNNYVVFDKLYDIPKNGTEPVPAYGNRVYIATLDALEDCDYDKTKLRKYKKDHGDFKVAYYNHTDTDSYQERIKEVLEYHDISTIKFKELKLKRD